MSDPDRVPNTADKIGMTLALVIGPVLWIYVDWKLFMVCALVGVIIGIAWGTPPARSQKVEEGRIEDLEDRS